MAPLMTMPRTRITQMGRFATESHRLIRALGQTQTTERPGSRLNRKGGALIKRPLKRGQNCHFFAGSYRSMSSIHKEADAGTRKWTARTLSCLAGAGSSCTVVSAHAAFFNAVTM